MRAAEFGIVLVMVVVRFAPDAAGAERQDAEDAHETLGQPGFGQDRVMLLVVVNHKQPEHEQPAQQAAGDASGQREMRAAQARQGSDETARQQKGCGQDAPPAFYRVVGGEGLGRQNKFFSV